MLAIRMQRTGRKGHAMFRVIVQDSRRTPSSGKVVAQIGSYDPHAKTVSVDKEKATFYLANGAQPSGRVASLLKAEGVKLPNWVIKNDAKTGKIRNADKLRRNHPAEPVTEAEAVPDDEVEATAEAPATDTPEVTAAAEEPVIEDRAQAEAAPATEEPTPESVEEKPVANDEKAAE